MAVPLGPGPWQGAVDVLNAKGTKRVIVDVAGYLGNYMYRVLDAKGDETGRGSVRMDAGPHGFTVPPGGMLTLRAGLEMR